MFIGVARCVELALLLATMVSGVQVPDLSLTLTNERTTIERTYELTKYLEHQLKDIKDTYLSYLGPPFSDPDFSPPRPNSSSLSVPSAATRVELWRGLENGARLAQNQRAYRVLLCAMRELARSTLCPYLQSSLLHFCSGLNGLLGSITGLMGSLGYVSPPQLADGTVLLPSGGVGGASLLLAEHRASPRAVAPGQHSPAPIRAQQQTQRHHGDHSRQRARDEQRHGGGGAATMGGGGAKEEPVRRRGERGERGRRGRRREEEAATAAAWEVEEMDEETAREGGMERWGRRRRLLSIDELELEEASLLQLYNINNNNNNNNNDKNNKYTISTQTQVGERDRMDERAETLEDLLYVSSSSSSSSSSSPSSSQHHRSPRSLSSLYSGTLPPSLSLLLQYGPGGAGVGVGARTGAAAGVPPDGAHSLLAAPLLSAHPVSSEFSRKVEGFWVLRELQSWLWRSAKDFNRLKKRLKA